MANLLIKSAEYLEYPNLSAELTFMQNCYLDV